jgi:hypothetical protein
MPSFSEQLSDEVLAELKDAFEGDATPTANLLVVRPKEEINPDEDDAFTTNNLLDGISTGGAGAYYGFGQSGTYLKGSTGAAPDFVGNIPGAIATYGGVGSAYPLFNMFGVSQTAWIQSGAPTTKLPTIIVGSAGTIAFWTGGASNYRPHDAIT